VAAGAAGAAAALVWAGAAALASARLFLVLPAVVLDIGLVQAGQQNYAIVAYASRSKEESVSWGSSYRQRLFLTYQP
jgi:hypothetical protein